MSSKPGRTCVGCTRKYQAQRCGVTGVRSWCSNKRVSGVTTWVVLEFCHCKSTVARSCGATSVVPIRTLCATRTATSSIKHSYTCVCTFLRGRPATDTGLQKSCHGTRAPDDTSTFGSCTTNGTRTGSTRQLAPFPPSVLPLLQSPYFFRLLDRSVHGLWLSVSIPLVMLQFNKSLSNMRNSGKYSPLLSLMVSHSHHPTAPLSAQRKSPMTSSRKNLCDNVLFISPFVDAPVTGTLANIHVRVACKTTLPCPSVQRVPHQLPVP